MERVFRLNAKKLSFTYSQCPPHWTKELVLAKYQTIRPDLKEYVIGQEYHQDGGLHYHGYVEYVDRVDIRGPNTLDIENHHGQYKTLAKGKQVWIAYCKKNGDYITNIKEQPTKEEKNKLILEQAKEKGVASLLEDGKINLKEYKWVSESFNLYMQEKKTDLRDELPSRLDNPWLNDFVIDLDLKRCHLWIWSKEPNLGKTTWLMNLYKAFMCQFWNITETFQDHITVKTQAILFDEFRGNLKISTLNSICDGTYRIPQKGKMSIMLENKPLVIVCGNKSIEECYKEANVPYVLARFNEYEINKFK